MQLPLQEKIRKCLLKFIYFHNKNILQNAIVWVTACTYISKFFYAPCIEVNSMWIVKWSKSSYVTTPLCHHLHLSNAFSASQDLFALQNAIVWVTACLRLWYCWKRTRNYCNYLTDQWWWVTEVLTWLLWSLSLCDQIIVIHYTSYDCVIIT